MNLQEFCLLMISVLSSAAGQLFLKIGADKLGRVTGGNVLNLILSFVTVPELIIGLSCYGIGAISYILLLTRVNLSVAGPSVSLTYIFSVLIGYFYFNDAIPAYRLLGLAFIVCGVILVVWQKS